MIAILNDQGEGKAAIAGELNFASVPQIFQQGMALMKRYKQLDFDFTHVSRSDSTGLALLLSWLRQGLKRKKTVRYHTLPQQMLAMAYLSDLDTVLPIVGTR